MSTADGASTPLDINGIAVDTPLEEVSAPSGDGQQVGLGEVGKSGTYIFNGIITLEEYNADLQHKQALKVYDRMRRSDGTVSAALLACKLPILSTTWSIQPASTDNQVDIDAAEFVRRELFDRNVVWTDVLREILTYFDFGHDVHEIVFELCDFNGQEVIGLQKLGYRKQRSIYKWQQQNGQPGITQYVPGHNYDIPLEKLLVFTNQKEGDNFEGISLLRPAYKHWDIKDKLYLIDAIKLERQALGIIEIEVPDGAKEEDVNDAVQMAQNARANEEAFLKKPAGWTIQFMDMKSNTTADVMPSVLHHDGLIVKSVLAQFLNLGQSGHSGGSKALSADHSALFELSLEAAAKNVASVIQKNLIQQLVDLNFSGVTGYPRLEHGKIGDEDIKTISDAVSTLVTARAVTPDAAMEQALRTILHLPDLPDDYKDDYANRPFSAAAGDPSLNSINPNNNDPADSSSDNDNADNSDVTASDAIKAADGAKAQLLAALEVEYVKG